MDDESQVGRTIKWALGALGLGTLAAAVGVPIYGRWLIWVALAILVLALLLFGGYFLWWRWRSRREQRRFSAAIETQTGTAPKSISDPNSRAKLDQLRQKFQKGLQEFKRFDKDLYKLPWYVIIGEPGSGKTEALRHSGIEFPPGLQDELQGSGGTVNMDWWFTNRAIILDTAGSMVFNEARAGEAPEWREFLRLLQKSRPHSPINGLFLVLSIESLIKDSSETIARKSSRLAQQLDLIQRTLNVRFPVFLLVTKCDLLTGFREFFDSIDDPLLQHQMFGWSNPGPLDEPFRPDLVEQYLKSIVERLRRRRLALLREGSGGGRQVDTSHFYQPGRAPAAGRRLDEVDAMFALPESMIRLAPRLRRYLETIFVAGEWSAKPVFLRGIYFTTSMREGRALDEAIALATGLSLDQLPEDRLWEKNRAFFLRDLFHEKVFHESGLVTRATNTLKLLRKRQLAIFGTAAGALLLLLAFGWYGQHKLGKSIGNEAKYWRAGTAHWQDKIWQDGSIVSPDPQKPNRFVYRGTHVVEGTKLTVVDYHRELRKAVTNNLAGGWIFKPISWIGRNFDKTRQDAQRVLFEAGVLRPLIKGTRDKMMTTDIPYGDPKAMSRHANAWISLLQLETDKLNAESSGSIIARLDIADKHLTKLLAYLAEDDNSKLDGSLVQVFLGTYASAGSGRGQWPPESLLGGRPLSKNLALSKGLEKFNAASVRAQTNIVLQLNLLNELTDGLTHYHQKEREWLMNKGSCLELNQTLLPLKTAVDASWSGVQAVKALSSRPLTNLALLYSGLETNASKVTSDLVAPVDMIAARANKKDDLVEEIRTKLGQFFAQAGEVVRTNFSARAKSVAELDTNCISTNNVPLYELRWQLYSDACSLDGLATSVPQWNMQSITNARNRFVEIEERSKSTNTAAQSVNLAEFRRKVERSKQQILKAIDGDLQKRIRFPVNLRDSTVSMTRNGVRDLRVLLEGLANEVTNRVWQAENPATVEGLLKRWEVYAPILGLLVTSNGSPRNWKISFVGSKRSSDDYKIISVYRYVQIIMSETNVLNDLTLVDAGTTKLIGKGGSVDHGIRVRFKKSPDDPDDTAVQALENRDWGLLRLIRDNPNGRSEDGSTWTIRIPLAYPKLNITGDAIFMVQPDPDEALPKIEDWRKD